MDKAIDDQEVAGRRSEEEAGETSDTSSTSPEVWNLEVKGFGSTD